MIDDAMDFTEDYENEDLNCFLSYPEKWKAWYLEKREQYDFCDLLPPGPSLLKSVIRR